MTSLPPHSRLRSCRCDAIAGRTPSGFSSTKQSATINRTWQLAAGQGRHKLIQTIADCESCSRRGCIPNELLWCLTISAKSRMTLLDLPRARSGARSVKFARDPLSSRLNDACRESILDRKISRKIIQALPPPQKLARPPCARIPWNRCIPSDSGIAPACRRRPSTARRSKLSNRDTIDTREIDCEMRMNERRLRVGLACSNLDLRSQGTFRNDGTQRVHSAARYSSVLEHACVSTHMRTTGKRTGIRTNMCTGTYAHTNCVNCTKDINRVVTKWYQCKKHECIFHPHYGSNATLLEYEPRMNVTADRHGLLYYRIRPISQSTCIGATTIEREREREKEREGEDRRFAWLPCFCGSHEREMQAATHSIAFCPVCVFRRNKSLEDCLAPSLRRAAA